MQDFVNYLINNFFLICISCGVIFMVLHSDTLKGEEKTMPIGIVGVAIIISIFYAIEMVAIRDPNMVFLATFCYWVGFALRPLYVLFFLRIREHNKIILRIALGLVIANAVIYSISLFLFAPDVANLMFHYALDPKTNTLVAVDGPLRFVSYVVVGIMTAYLIFISLRALKGRHRLDAIASLICVAFIGLAVLLETLKVATNLLNTVVVVAVLFYGIHLYQQAMIRDPLTNLFTRKMFYGDQAKLEKKITGMILVDMNCLKYINDNFGHFEGDKALVTIANVLDKASDGKNMYPYRLGGDEFLILSTSSDKRSLEKAADKINVMMAPTTYSVSIGYAYRLSPEQSSVDIMKKAEEEMYKDKKAFYERTGYDRARKPINPPSS